MGKMAFIMTSIMDEVTEELTESRTPEEIAVMLAQIGMVIAWIGHGRNEQLPPELVPFAEMINPSAPAQPTTESNAGTHAESPAEIEAAS